MEKQIIPQINQQYLDKHFWEQRYSQYVQPRGEKSNKTDLDSDDQMTPVREWFGSYDMFAHIFRQSVPKSASILIIGCGNSLLGEQLFDDGYRNIHNTDISESVIQLMSNHCTKCAQFKWTAMDCRQLDFPDAHFDVIIEKATIEVFLVAEHSPWSISEAAILNVKKVADEITRVLKPMAGHFFSISFNAPHFRQKLFDKVFPQDIFLPGKSMRTRAVHQLGVNFHYYLYHLSNDPRFMSVPTFSYQPPKVTILENKQEGAEELNKEDLFLYNISI